jgi:hypothetical protein
MLPIDPSQAPSQSLATANALKEPKAEKVRTSNGGSTVRFRQPTGLFSKKPKAPTAAEVQKATAAKITAVSPESPKSEWELMVEAMTELAKNPTEKTASASVKAFEALSKVSGFSTKPEEKGTPITTIYIAMPDLPYSGELNDRPQKALRPSFADEIPYLDGEVVS